RGQGPQDFECLAKLKRARGGAGLQPALAPAGIRARLPAVPFKAPLTSALAAAFLLPFQIRRAVWIFRRRINQASFHWILFDVIAVLQEARPVQDADLGKSGLPDFLLIIQFFPCAI